MIALKDTYIEIDIDTNFCKECNSLTSLHFRAFEKCFMSYNISFNIVLKNVHKRTIYYILKSGVILLMEPNTDIHIYKSRQNR